MMTPHARHASNGSDNIRLRAVLMARLRQMMRAQGLTQMQAARWFHVSQSRVSHLVNDRRNRFTIDTLANMLAHAGVHVSVIFEQVQDLSAEPYQAGRNESAAHL